ncbi:SMP-30/gluconolactonase/LRE family protein [Catenovulum adriaticum]|uniref:SMP-30/gluconolactonase/LRE family protein n=1 Tax=Catenovulum adriaticum TaxID=2984846 RepID=A0ABY7AM19_9ALTE|nr:SMP-30/gluconolactonase/LRE family protein [Catenovulum sp. TS8]WAJ70191.1 SMP-30/gluconolactonase/LRE family protein [Catenovulum sp. TS8]
MPIKKYFKTLFSASFISATALYSQLSVAADIKPNAVVAADAQLVQVSDQFEFTEGPAVDQAGNVYFTDQPNNKIYLWKTDNSIELFMTPAGRANGLFIDEQGNILACADEDNQLWKILPDKSKTVLVEEVNNKAFNGPNDVWISDVGDIYFTDPYYQRDYWKRTNPELKTQSLYRLDKKGQLQLLDADFTKPNGIVGFKNKLYVADIGANKTYAYTINKNGTLSDKRVFTEQGSDGMTIDEQGNLYLTGKGVMVFNPQGEQIAHIPVEKAWTANVTFAGKHRKTLFITAMDSVYTLKMKVAGVK